MQKTTIGKISRGSERRHALEWTSVLPRKLALRRKPAARKHHLRRCWSALSLGPPCSRRFSSQPGKRDPKSPIVRILFREKLSPLAEERKPRPTSPSRILPNYRSAMATLRASIQNIGQQLWTTTKPTGTSPNIILDKMTQRQFPLASRGLRKCSRYKDGSILPG